jgi:hypothetical protein
VPRPRTVSAKNRPYKHVELSEGDWINIKRKLNYGEASDLYDATYRSSVGGAEVTTAREVRMSVFNVQRIMLYILDWSFIDDENKSLPISVESIRALDQETTLEIHTAITDVENEVAQEEREGNARAGNRMGSPSGSAGLSLVTQDGGSPPDANA